jgi:hypothetical protein
MIHLLQAGEVALLQQRVNGQRVCIRISSFRFEKKYAHCSAFAEMKKVGPGGSGLFRFLPNL